MLPVAETRRAQQARTERLKPAASRFSPDNPSAPERPFRHEIQRASFNRLEALDVGN